MASQSTKDNQDDDFEISYAKDVSNFVCTLLDSWGYDRKELDIYDSPSFDVSLDLDITHQDSFDLVCRCIFMCPFRDEKTGRIFTPPRTELVSTSNEKRVSIATINGLGSWEGPSFCIHTLDLYGVHIQPCKGDYPIPKFDKLVFEDPIYHDLKIIDEQGTFSIGNEYLHKEKGTLHVELFEKWINLLNNDEKAKFGVSIQPKRIDIFDSEEANEALASGYKVYAFTTTLGKWCVFDMGLTYDKQHFRTLIAALDVSVTDTTTKELEEQGYHFFIQPRFLSHDDATKALMKLRRAATRLV